jgi:NADH-quinone oxidoreductase subunit A
MLELLTLSFSITIAAAVALSISSRSTTVSEPQKTPFLGGSAPRTHAWQRFHVRYYPMTLVFVAFEMEMMFMYPWAVVYVQSGMKALVEMGMFLAILSIGILYAWREGAFRWQ